jgi:hypothetical protein
LDKDEVIRRLKEHLRGRENMNGELTFRDRAFCIRYVSDFLDMTHAQAIRFLEKNVPQAIHYNRDKQNNERKCRTCVYAKPIIHGKSKCYIECTHQAHIEKIRTRKISAIRPRTNPACKCYKENMEEE